MIILVTIELIGGCVGTNVVFDALIIEVSRNSSLLLSQVISGFAFAKATVLFAFIITFLLLYVYWFYLEF